ncbi:facilitated trehalose transporter Tret1-like [Maniola hyperantus]|uniref:facilitated trehalose transporter Tret1-like n=1 Tax=Aphantopus hyperantus TaxID=2795564 RepID=UPI003748223D
MGATTVIVPQLRKEANSTDAVTPEMASWLSSMFAYSAIPWVFIAPMLAYRFGRKVCLILITINVIIGNIIFYCSTSFIELLISQTTQGMLLGSIVPISVMVLSEYTSPKYRGILFTIKAATTYWGVWVSNAIGTFFHWRNIGIVIFICSIYNFISCIFCCESPYWLASKGRFDECAKVHRWLKGTNVDSEEELRKLILSQQENLNLKNELNGQIKVKKYLKILNIIRRESFYKPFVYACLPMILYNATGKIACTVYAIDIIKNITSSERMAYEGMLILDAVTVVGMYLGCALSKVVTRRKQLLVFSSAGIGFLYGLSIYLYMLKFHIVPENNYISLVFLMGFSISIGCGPIILAPCCSAELSPLRNRSYFLCLQTFMNNLFLATSLKISPAIFKVCGTAGGFLFYAVCSTVSIFIVYKYLPETKDLTIQEIEKRITTGNRHDRKTAETEIVSLK